MVKSTTGISAKRPLYQEPYWQTTDEETVKLYHGNALKVLDRLPCGIVQSVVTSPPYWGLRDYGQDKGEEIGCEKTPQEYIEKLVAIFRQAKRVLRDDGTVFLNLGDTYGTDNNRNGVTGTNERSLGVSRGNLIGIPWRVALALQADGWILRSDMPWVKASTMPESCTDQPAKALEYVFLLAKNHEYYFDMEAVRKPADSNGKQRYAIFPENFIEPLIMCGTSEYGCCAKCRMPYERIIEVSGSVNTIEMEGSRNRVSSTIGWCANCHCSGCPSEASNSEEVIPCTVLDPFIGSGTAAIVAIAKGRSCWGIELSEQYLVGNAISRIEGRLLSLPAYAHLIPKR